MLSPPSVSNGRGPATAERTLHRRLRDILDHRRQFGPMLVHGRDGRLYLACGALQPHQPDIDPFPYREPLHRAGEPADALLDFRNHADLVELEASLAGWGIQNLTDIGTGTAGGDHVLARANLVGSKRIHDFQVVWIGSRKEWLVLEGGIRWPEYDNITGSFEVKTQLYDRIHLDGIAGWIVLPVDVEPGEYDSESVPPPLTSQVGYKLTAPAAPIITSSPSNSPPELSLDSFSLSPPGPPYREVRNWGAGRFMLPIARVEPPGTNGTGTAGTVPMIHQFSGGSWNVSSDGTAVWTGTFPKTTFTTLAP